MKGPPRRSTLLLAAGLLRDFPRAALLSLRLRRELAEVRQICLFVGTPKTGHSLVGALLDAHPRMAIAHEADVALLLRAGFRRRQILALLVDYSRRQARRGRRESGYSYDVPGQWQGRWERLRVVGDKHAEGLTLRLGLRPALWERLERTLGRPRFVHVVRNPFDAISSLTRPASRRLDLAAATDYHLRLCETVRELRGRLADDRYHELRHEALIAAPADELARLARFLGEEAPADWLAACSAVVFPAPRRAREGGDWSPAAVRRVESRLAEFPFLAGYSFDG